MTCPRCGSENTEWYSGAFIYKAIRCTDCHTETDANNMDSFCPIEMEADAINRACERSFLLFSDLARRTKPPL